MENTIIKNNKLKKVLRLFCVLSFIGSSFWLLISMLLIFMNSDYMHEFLLPYIERTGNNLDAFIMKYEHAVLIGISKSILNALSLFGIILMYRIKKNGLYIYVFAQLAILFVSPIINKTFSFKIFDLSIAIIWILIYTSIFYFISKKIKNEDIIENV